MADATLVGAQDLVEAGRAHRRVYVDPAIFEQEMDRIFGRLWLYVAHESQLKQHGDFVRAQLGRHEVIVARHSDGTIHVMQNRCPHRGARLCMTDRGHTRRLTCPYHAWGCRTDGSLAAVPHPSSYPASFDMADPANRLPPVPRVASYRGFVFASLAADGPTLAEHLGDMADAIDNLVDRAPDGDVELAETSFQLEYRGNWKFHNENAADVFHPGFVHSSSVGTAMASPSGASSLDDDQTRDMMLANGFGRDEWEGIQFKGLPGGHTYMGGFYRQGMLAPERVDPVRDEYRQALVGRHGASRAAEILGVNRFNNLIFPTMNLNAQYQQMRVVVPLAVDRTLIRVSCFRLLGAPDGIFHRAVRFLTTLGSPASMIFSDDVEMLARCQAGLAGSDSEWLNFERGMGTDETGTPGHVSGRASELPMRHQLHAWAHYMAAA
jgi:phenylpropionate dioxygenase-like ring-hydroxylating dioxygenase large terminal subunit